MKFVLASHNRKKLAEMQEILRELGVEVTWYAGDQTGRRCR